MRNGIYTLYQGYHLPVSTVRDDGNLLLISWYGETCPFPEFDRSSHEPNLFLLIVPADSIEYLYEVKTFGTYKNFTFQVFDHPPDPGKIFVGIKNGEALRQLELSGDENWAYAELDPNRMDKIWETRNPVFNKKLPEAIEPEFFIRR